MRLAGAAPRAPHIPQATYTNKKLFSIPFAIDSRHGSTQRLSLFVSADRGATWKLYQTRPATRRRFDFHAGADGEFWFAVRLVGSVERLGRSTSPEKVVVVDTTKPLLSLEARRLGAGRVVAKWIAEDRGLDASSFILAYQSNRDSEWVSVRTVRPTHQQSRFDGEVSWSFAPSEFIRIKGEVRDQAGNVASLERMVEFGSLPQVAATNRSTPNNLTNYHQSRGDDRPSDRESTPKPSRQPERARWSSLRTPLQTTHQQIRRPAADQDKQPEPANTGRDSEDGFPDYDSSIFEEDFGEDYPLEVDQRLIPDRDPVVGDFGYETTEPPPSRRRTQKPISDPPKPITNKNGMASFVTNSLQFNLDYDVNDADFVSRVELWVTTDQGESWQPFGIDADRISPMLVEVERDGRYGFQLLVHGQDGRSTRPPQSGERPDINVIVDSQRPDAYLTGAEYLKGDQRLLKIEWRAQDETLKKRGITLSYSETQNGPWVIIAKEVANSGYYEWRPKSNMPESFFIQIDVLDEAGNRTVHRLPQAIRPISGAPRAKIRAIRSSN